MPGCPHGPLEVNLLKGPLPRETSRLAEKLLKSNNSCKDWAEVGVEPPAKLQALAKLGSSGMYANKVHKEILEIANEGCLCPCFHNTAAVQDRMGPTASDHAPKPCRTADGPAATIMAERFLASMFFTAISNFSILILHSPKCVPILLHLNIAEPRYKKSAEGKLANKELAAGY